MDKNEIEIAIRIPSPPEGWVYDGYRVCTKGERWFTGDSWVEYFVSTAYPYPIAVKVPPPWEPTPEIVAAVLLLHGSGWLTWDSTQGLMFHEKKPYQTSGGYWYSLDATVQFGNCQFTGIDWQKACFKIGEPQQ